MISNWLYTENYSEYAQLPHNTVLSSNSENFIYENCENQESMQITCFININV